MGLPKNFTEINKENRQKALDNLKWFVFYYDYELTDEYSDDEDAESDESEADDEEAETSEQSDSDLESDDAHEDAKASKPAEALARRMSGSLTDLSAADEKAWTVTQLKGTALIQAVCKESGREYTFGRSRALKALKALEPETLSALTASAPKPAT